MTSQLFHARQAKSMSKQSDNNNHSNQLNPNNAEYWNCRGDGASRGGNMYDDDDEPATYRSRGTSTPSNWDRIERLQFYFAAVAFDGTAVHVRFKTEANVGFLAGHGKAHEFAENAKDALLSYIRRHCPAGAAYWRLATDESRGEFYWYTPDSGPTFPGEEDRQKKLRWETAIRQQSRDMDLLFDWNKHEAAADLGIIASDTISFAPASDDLTQWSRQLA
jgi:hypothetical protein